MGEGAAASMLRSLGYTVLGLIMLWSTQPDRLITLSTMIYNYAIGCQGGTNGLLSHNAARSTDYQALGDRGYVGENIYGSSGSGATPDDAMSLWMSEASSYDYASGNIGSAGHYTQIVWRDSVRIGCAIVDCPSVVEA